MTRPRDGLAALLRDGAHLDRLALEIARLGYPALDIAPSLAELDRLADGLRSRLMDAVTAEELATVVSTHLGRDGGFRGNTDDYYDPRNSFLNDVLVRRTGIPITLSAVYIEVGRRAGLTIEGIGFPGHFLVRLATRHGSVLLDPFNGGRTVGERELRALLLAAHGSRAPRTIPDAFLARVENRAIVERMLRNLLRIHLERDDPAAAVSAVDLLLVLVPDSAADVRTRGMLYERLECSAAARNDFERYLELTPAAEDADEIRARLARLPRATLH